MHLNHTLYTEPRQKKIVTPQIWVKYESEYEYSDSDGEFDKPNSGIEWQSNYSVANRLRKTNRVRITKVMIDRSGIKQLLNQYDGVTC